MAILIGYKRCTTCKQVEKLLQEKNISYTYREIDKENPTAEELKAWQEKTQLPLKRFFNTSGIIYREEKLATKLPNMTDEEQFNLLSTDGKLVKRPILILDNGDILVGPDVKKYLNN